MVLYRKASSKKAEDSQKSESELTRALCKDLERMNALVFSVVGNRMQRPGLPDRYVAHRRWQGWLEFKASRGKLTEAQRITLRELNSRGVNTYVVRFGGLHSSQIEDWEGRRLAEWNGTAVGLLDALEGLE